MLSVKVFLGYNFIIMLKRLAILTLMSVLAVHCPAQKQDRSSLAQDETDKQPAPAASSVDKGTSAPNQKCTDTETPPWWKSPEWWLCILGIPTLIFIGWQARATAESTKVMQRSIEVQEAEFAQWLDIGEWAIEHDRSVHFSRSGNQVFNAPDELKVRLSFPLLNNTSRPLFIKFVRTLLAIGTIKAFKTFMTEENESLSVPPKDEYRVEIDTILDKDQVLEYIGYTFPIEAVVMVKFSNALNKPEDASFRRLIMCNAFEGITTVSKGHISKEEIHDRKSV
jgi:hypothetical protein